MAGIFHEYLRPGETVVFQTARRLLPRGWGADLTLVLALSLGLVITDEQFRAITTSHSWESEMLGALGVILLVRLFRYFSDLRMLTAITEQRLLNVRQGLLLNWSKPELTEIELSEISVVFAHPYNIVVETNNGRPQKFEIPFGAKALAAWLEQSQRVETIVPTQLEAIARFMSLNLPLFIGVMATFQLFAWMLAMLPGSEFVTGFIRYFDLQPGEFRKIIIALTFALPTLFLAGSIAMLLASLTLFLVVLIFAAHIHHRRAVEILTISPESQRKSQDKFVPGWWHLIESLVFRTVYQRGQPG